jgi:NADPH-dependent 2,4-dienoyl-CoA reductase/sulfur reductase-like enzyme
MQSSIEARKAELAQAARQLAAAQSLLIVGGGSVGVELAAEVAGRYGRSKKVVLVTSADRCAAAALQPSQLRARLGHGRWPGGWDERSLAAGGVAGLGC